MGEWRSKYDSLIGLILLDSYHRGIGLSFCVYSSYPIFGQMGSIFWFFMILL